MAKHIPFFLLSLFLLLLSFCIQLVLVDKPPSLSCKENQFPCRDGSKCVSRSRDLCDGYTDCDDYSDELASQCKNCTESNLFKCQKGGKEVCRREKEEVTQTVTTTQMSLHLNVTIALLTTSSRVRKAASTFV